MERSGCCGAKSRYQTTNTAISVIHRSDGSGTTFNWADYLRKSVPSGRRKSVQFLSCMAGGIGRKEQQRRRGECDTHQGGDLAMLNSPMYCKKS